MTSFMADHVIDVARQVELFWPHNEHVANEMLISRLLDDVLCDLFPDPASLQSSPGQWDIAPGVMSYSTRQRTSFADAAQVVAASWRGGQCDRCNGYSPSYPTQALWVPTGSRIIEFNCCKGCVDYLEAEYSPVAWM